MVGYGESVFFITDKPIDQSEFLFDSLDISSNPSRYKLFHDYKREWIKWVRWQGNNDYGDREFYELHEEILSVYSFHTPKVDKMHLKLIETYQPSLEFLSTFGDNYIYELDGGNFKLYYDITFDNINDDELKFMSLLEECGKGLFAWLVEYIKERINNGSKVNRLLRCEGGIPNNHWSDTAILNCTWIDLDVDKIEIPDNSFKYFSDEFQKRDLEFSGYNFGINFY